MSICIEQLLPCVEAWSKAEGKNIQESHRTIFFYQATHQAAGKLNKENSQGLRFEMKFSSKISAP